MGRLLSAILLAFVTQTGRQAYNIYVLRGTFTYHKFRNSYVPRLSNNVLSNQFFLIITAEKISVYLMTKRL